MQKSSLQLVTGPAVEPVSVLQAKAHLRISDTQDDVYVSALITAAREYAENYTKRAFFNQTWLLTLDMFPYVVPAFASWIDAFAVNIPRPRLQEIVSIKYIDQSNTQQTLPSAQFAVDNTSEPARITPIAGGTWPYPSVYTPGTVQITFLTGTYGDGTDVNTCPMSICQAMLLLIGHWYAQREAVAPVVMTQVPLAVQALLDPYRVHSLLV